MIHLFRKRKAGRQSKASQKIVEWLDNRLKSLAAYLSRKMAHVQPRIVAAIIMAACFSFSVCLSTAVFRTTRIRRDIQVHAIRAPFINPYRQRPTGDVLLQRIRHFHQQLDSLRQTDVLRYDSLMKSRPHLLDSMRTAEQLWNE